MSSVWDWFMIVGISGVVATLLVVQLQERAERWEYERHKED